jgi:hypothetical protein
MLLLFGVVPAALLVGATVAGIHEGTVAWDFQRSFLPATRAVLHGLDPYRTTTSRTLHDGTAFVYPPVAAYLFAALALLPPLAASLVFTAICLASVLLTLALLGVRDLRCYGAAAAWAPVFSAVHLGAISTLLALGIAVAWRFRHSPWRSGVAIGLVVAVKLFLWPLLLWLCAVRYWRSAAIAAGASLGFILLPWAGLGFAGFAGYPHVLHELASVEASEGYTIAAAALKLGTSWPLALTLGALVAVGLGAALLVAGRAGRERAALALAIGLALAASPIVWLHYLAVLLVVVALYRPRFGLVWLLPVALFAFPITPGASSGWGIVTVLAGSAALVALAAATGNAASSRPSGWDPEIAAGG